MTNEFLALASLAASARPVVLDPATAALDDLMARVGVDGLTAAFADPGLLARLDQHAAAVRDALADASRNADAEGLAAYARSIVFAAKRAGKQLPEPGQAAFRPEAWAGADWHILRLVAVCMIADEDALLHP
jgi:hypothetical protein